MARKQLTLSRRQARAFIAASALLAISTEAFCPGTPANMQKSSSFSQQQQQQPSQRQQRLDLQLSKSPLDGDLRDFDPIKFVSTVAVTIGISASIVLGLNSPALAENELSAKYGGKGFDSSLVDQTCLMDKCSLQAKACLADDPDCRKGLTCTAKCLGDNACITGCMARYGDDNLDNLLKCTIEDNECIKVAILDGGADKFGEEPKPPAPTVRNFKMNTMEGQWYKVAGFNPNYDCYACQKNTFSVPPDTSVFGNGGDKLEVDVRFSMPRMMPDGTPPPPTNERESISSDNEGLMFGSKSIGFNDYETRETMVFDSPKSILKNVVLNKGSSKEASYARTAHSEGEMFGLKFWENWYIIGENDPSEQEFKFVYYNGKTRQNTYEGAFVYSRTRDLDMASMKKVYQIASDAGMNPDQFCKIRNGCFKDEVPDTGMGSTTNPFRGIIASTKVSQLLGVEPVAAENVMSSTKTATAKAKLQQSEQLPTDRHWWHEAGDYLENPHRHFNAMDSLRQTYDWPEEVRAQAQK